MVAQPAPYRANQVIRDETLKSLLRGQDCFRWLHRSVMRSPPILNRIDVSKIVESCPEAPVSNRGLPQKSRLATNC
jgi:hypothetical protein